MSSQTLGLGGWGSSRFARPRVTCCSLQARIAATIGFLASVPREAIDGKEDASITVKLAGSDHPFTGLSYATGFALPNFFFHVTTAYALLRQHGVPIGKFDYLGRAG